MAVTATLPLLVEIGNQTPDALFTGNESWQDYKTSGEWGAFYLGDFEVNASSVVLTPDQGGAVVVSGVDDSLRPRWTAGINAEVCIVGSEIYWKWLPFDANEVQFDLFVQDFFGNFSIVIEITNGEMFVDAGSADRLETYDPDIHLWWRIVEDSGTVLVQNAGPGTSYVWDTFVTYVSPFGEEFEERNALYFDFYMERLTGASDYSREMGWIGAINQVPVPRELPLLVEVGDPLVSRVIKTLPLLVDIGDP